MKQYLMRFVDVAGGNSISSVTIMAKGRIRSVQFGVIPQEDGVVVNGFYELQVGTQPVFEDVPSAQGQANVAARAVCALVSNNTATQSRAAFWAATGLVPADLGVEFGQVIYLNGSTSNNNTLLTGFVIVNVM